MLTGSTCIQEVHPAACIVPDDFAAADGSHPILTQPECTYALLTIEEPNGRSSSRIAQGIRTILEVLHAQGIRKTAKDGFLPCFERRYQCNGMTMAEIFLQCRDAEPKEVITLN